MAQSWNGALLRTQPVARHRNSKPLILCCIDTQFVPLAPDEPALKQTWNQLAQLCSSGGKSGIWQLFCLHARFFRAVSKEPILSVRERTQKGQDLLTASPISRKHATFYARIIEFINETWF